MAAAFENPPQIRPQVDENGNVMLKPEEWAALLMWLQKFKDYTQDNLP